MSVAIVLRLDQAAVSLIDAMAEALPDRRTGTRHSPHIKLAVYDDHINVNNLDRAMVTVTTNWKRVPITLAGVGVFPGEPATLWLAVPPTAALMAYHATLHEGLVDPATNPHYRVGSWVPHVVVRRTEFLGDAVEVLACCRTGSISGTLDFLDIVQVETGEVIRSRPLLD
jgi:2'-5' RNA ligase